MEFLFCPYSSSSHSRQKNWTGKVGIMNPSDYGYATSGGENINSETCLAQESNGWERNDCVYNNWFSNRIITNGQLLHVLAFLAPFSMCLTGGVWY